ncbi:prephenate dehydrogenase [Kerstersia gyiorum]|uniref:prephenate dehydrogenase n=1 Tax=Kerstersia gyiorum TaxID=206506 RepID=UPI00209C90CC|nr:prephenate dehydrogenase/arogenate dehydrogenase family protein [Kerstersia gyiorum]MCP1633753.1 prephenate dehydrogenase [Kerstersia gyiorum]MCP1683105.1 prephenate dehydrogenase [Kerstersia gyiorum]MCP1718658.1 prephenate dehydrogenase [Kerstersia gyiorum]MCW2187790.1 prephenate dehydrogenase [Kerstersia gyiorum]
MNSPLAADGNGTGVCQTLAVVGVGLIGGSFAAGLRAAGRVGRVLGVGRQRKSLDEALDLGLIDAVASPEQAAREADIILLATPVSAMGAILGGMKDALSSRAVLTDAGSTKADVIEQARLVLGDKVAQFVPGHPIAGSHATGPQAADADLYRGRNVILTPLPENDPQAVAHVASLWRACGARTRLMTPDRHDGVFAAVSHLPHWLAAAYVHYLETGEDADLRFELAGSGFRDFTRIAAGSPEMWRDVFISNKTAMQAELRALRRTLDRLEAALDRTDGDALQQWLDEAAQARRAWQPGGKRSD